MHKEKDANYLLKNLDLLPHHYTSADTSRMTLAFFGISGLDLLGKLEHVPQETKHLWTEWVYSQLINDMRPGCNDEAKMGFRGGSFSGASYSPQETRQCPVDDYDTAHLAMTYTALSILLILGDDLSKIPKDAILNAMAQLQQEDGSFIPYLGTTEADMRFLFCACAISYILNDWRAINKEKAVSFIKQCISYDGGFSQGPRQESHGGSTFCAIAALTLMNRLHDLTALERKSLQIWCLQRQSEGFHGRIGKQDDTCYSFWVGAAIQMLGVYSYVDKPKLFDFLEKTHSNFGGFNKTQSGYPDLLHSYMGLAGLSIANKDGMPALYAALNISERAHERMKSHCVTWK